MAEPALNLPDDIEPDIRPDLRVIKGGGNTTPERGNLRLLDKMESNPEDTNKGSVGDQEANGSNLIQAPWANKVSGNNKLSEKAGGKLSFIKKKGPLTTIILTLVGGGIGIGTLLSPGLLIVNLKEVMVNKFNVQLTSMDVRTTKILTKKTAGGLCTGIKIACKYSSMSEKQIGNFKEAGITVKKVAITNIDKSIVPDEFEFNGKSIKASEFSRELSKNTEFRTAVKKAYNPKFAGFSDSIWAKVTSKFKISKKAVSIDGDTDSEKLTSIQEDTKSGSLADDTKATELDPKATNEDGSLKYTDEEILASKNAAAAANEIADGAAEVAEDATKAGTKVLNTASNGLETAASTLKVSGVVDNVCTAYGMVQALGYGAKMVRAVQLARYAMLFLNVADQIKAGDAKAEDVAYLGTVLTTDVIATATTPRLGSATDSFGYKYAAYGETGTMSDIAGQFLAGGGLTGQLIGLTATINKYTDNAPRTTCAFLKNPFVGIGSAIVGIASMTTPIGWGKLAAQVGVGILLSVATAVIPGLLKDVVAGVLVDETTVGESAGDAITSGASGLMGTTAATGGNAPLTPSQAIAYSNLSAEVAAQYAEEDQLAYSPFDISNSNTFMGKIFAQIVPYVSKMSSLSGILSSITSLPIDSFASLTSQNTYAASETEYTMCTDMDYQEMGLATDPYCNVSYGLPADALALDPSDVASHLFNNGQIDENGAIIGTEYTDFISNCINRTRPLGDSGDTFDENLTGETCLIDSARPENKYYYVYYVDQRVEKGMDGEDSVLAAAQDAGLDSNISFYDGSSHSDNNIAAKSNSTKAKINAVKSAAAMNTALNIFNSSNLNYINIGL